VAKNQLRNMSEKYLNSTERQAIAKLAKIHQPILNEMEKWKEGREKLEGRLLEQIEMMGKILKPYYEQSRVTLTALARRKPLSTGAPNRKSSSRKKR